MKKILAAPSVAVQKEVRCLGNKGVLKMLQSSYSTTSSPASSLRAQRLGVSKCKLECCKAAKPSIEMRKDDLALLVICNYCRMKYTRQVVAVTIVEKVGCSMQIMDLFYMFDLCQSQKETYFKIRLSLISSYESFAENYHHLICCYCG